MKEFDENDENVRLNDIDEKKVFGPQKKTSYKLLYYILLCVSISAILIFFIILYFTLGDNTTEVIKKKYL